MALKDCKECGKTVSTEAKSCPHCGAKPPAKTSVITWLVGIFMVIVIFNFISNQADRREADAKKPTQTPAELAESEKADREIQAAIIGLRSIKAATKNPASFDLTSFVIYPGGSTCYEYRATNSFNAIVPGRAVFDADKGALLAQSSDGNKFVSAWNVICTKPGGNERSGGLKALGAY